VHAAIEDGGETEHLERCYDARPRSLRGILIGLLLSAPFWGGLIWLIRVLTSVRR